MSLEHFIGVFALFANISTVVGILIVYIKSKQSTSERIAKIEFIANTLWTFHLRRAGVEMVHSSLGTMESPLKISADVLQRYDSLKPALLAWHAKFGRHDMSDRELAIFIEHYFGARIAKEICIPFKMSQGECLLIATAVAKGGNQVDIPDVELSPEEASQIAADN